MEENVKVLTVKHGRLCRQGRSQYEARRGNCLVLFSSATNFCTFVPR